MTGRRRSGANTSQKNAATCLAMTAVIGCVLGFIAFTAVVLPRIRFVILVIGGLIAFFLMHYLTWGRWMSQYRDSDDEQVPPGAVDD